jgi:uncharacterized protein (DUF697 family)
METTTNPPISDEQALQARLAKANSVVKTNMLWSAGLGIIPIPVFDLVAITVVQIKMLKELSTHYNVKFFDHKVKNLVTSLVGGLGSVSVGGALTMSLVKFIPGAGHIAGAIAVPITAGALTYAIGRVFIQHFESGGTFLDFDPNTVREHFRKEFEEGKVVAKDMKEAQGAN